MAGKQAKIFSEQQVEDLLFFAKTTRNPDRNRRTVNALLHEALVAWRTENRGHGPVVTSERGGKMPALSIVIWFARAYEALGLKGCSPHSGRRTFITRAARVVHKAGGSLRDVQLLADHRSNQTTQRYIDGDSEAQRRLVSLI